jgi:mono/diheme cytochrome c family protein
MNRRILIVMGAVISLSLLLAACNLDVDRDDDVADDDPPVTEETPTPELDPTPPEEELPEEVAEMIEHGEEIYSIDCAGCHGPDGDGAEDDAGFRIPNLNGNSLVVAEEPVGAISTLLTGRGGMPRFSGMDDEEIAAVVTYIRQEWDNEAPHVEPETVEEVREDIYGDD